MVETGQEWLLISASTATAPASLRVTVWRRLKALGALYLHQSVCVLPSTPGSRRAVASLAERATQDGGEVRSVTICVSDPSDEAEWVQQMQQARNEEYQEVLDRLPSLFTELTDETARGRTTFEELEESEADLARFRAWLAKIAARDYFDADLGAVAHAELLRAEDAISAFAELAMDRDGVHLQSSTGPPPRVLTPIEAGALGPSPEAGTGQAGMGSLAADSS